MALKRVYTFDEETGLNLLRVTPAEAVSHDEVLEKERLTNWELATLYVVGLEGNATASEIGFALVMDRSTVAEIIRPLEQRRAIKKVAAKRGRKGAVALTDDGQDLLGKGLDLWRSANVALPKAGKTELGPVRNEIESSKKITAIA